MIITLTGKAIDNRGVAWTRDALTARIQRVAGWHVDDKASHRTDVLVAAQASINRRTSKVIAAEAWGVRVEPYGWLFDRLGELEHQPTTTPAELPPYRPLAEPPRAAKAWAPLNTITVTFNNGLPIREWQAEGERRRWVLFWRHSVGRDGMPRPVFRAVRANGASVEEEPMSAEEFNNLLMKPAPTEPYRPPFETPTRKLRI